MTNPSDFVARLTEELQEEDRLKKEKEKEEQKARRGSAKGQRRHNLTTMNGGRFCDEKILEMRRTGRYPNNIVSFFEFCEAYNVVPNKENKHVFDISKNMPHTFPAFYAERPGVHDVLPEEHEIESRDAKNKKLKRRKAVKFEWHKEDPVRGGQGLQSPSATISPKGLLSFNKKAVEDCGIDNKSYVVLGYSTERGGCIGFDFKEEKEPGALKLNKKKTGASTSIKNFLNKHDKNVESSYRFPLHEDEETKYIYLILSNGKEVVRNTATKK